jgi:hypothetical protein
VFLIYAAVCFCIDLQSDLNFIFARQFFQSNSIFDTMR